MRWFAFLFLTLALSGTGLTAAQTTSIPAEIRGDWTVEKNLSERSLGCFDSAHTRELIGLKLSLGERRLLWNGLPSVQLDPTVMQISSNTFLARYGKMPQELGLPPGRVTIADVHPSEGIPVNALIALGPSTILINACNLWLEATRDNSPAP